MEIDKDVMHTEHEIWVLFLDINSKRLPCARASPKFLGRCKWYPQLHTREQVFLLFPLQVRILGTKNFHLHKPTFSFIVEYALTLPRGFAIIGKVPISRVTVRKLASEYFAAQVMDGNTISDRSCPYTGYSRRRIRGSKTDAASRQPRFVCIAQYRFPTPFFGH